MEIQELPGITRFIPKILLALTVTVCDEVYKKIAYWLNDMGKRPPALVCFSYLWADCGALLSFSGHLVLLPLHWNFNQIRFLCFFVYLENYRLQSDYENNLIIKMVFVSHVFGYIF